MESYFCMECGKPLSSPIHSHCSECRREGNKKAAQSLVDAIQEPLKNQIADLEAQLAQAKADNAGLVEVLRWIKNNSDTGFLYMGQMCGKGTGEAIQKRCNEALSSPHPGADLLREMERAPEPEKEERADAVKALYQESLKLFLVLLMALPRGSSTLLTLARILAMALALSHRSSTT